MIKDRAVAYFRTSSATNAGVDKDSEARQRDAVRKFAKARKLTIVKEFYDAAVSGADAVTERAGFRELLAYCAGDGVKVVLVENASRFARDLAVQLAGHQLLRTRGIDLIPVDAPDHFTDPGPTAEMVRQILGSVSQFEKAQLVAKLRHARERIRAAKGKCEGRKGYAETKPDLLREAKRLARHNPVTGKRRSLNEIAAELARLGHVTAKGNTFSASQVQRMID